MATAAKFPAALLALADVFGEMPNFPQLTLNGSINASVTSIVVNESIPSTWPQVMWITIDSEILHVTSWATKTFTVAARDGSAGNAQSTTAATHADKAYVTPALTAQQWNQVVADLIAIETQFSQGADIASATGAGTLTPGTDGGYAHITGTTTINAIASLPKGRIFICEFTGALQLTYNATSLILQGSVNYTTAAGDVLAFISEGAGNWRELFRRTAAASGQVYPRTVQILPFMTYSAIVGTWVRDVNSAYWGAARIYNSSAAQNDSIQWDVLYDAGTYTWGLGYNSNTNKGIASLYIDGVSKGTIDMYAASLNNAVFTEVTGIALTAGVHTLKIIGATKNASSSGYGMELQAVTLVRTGA